MLMILPLTAEVAEVKGVFWEGYAIKLALLIFTN